MNIGRTGFGLIALRNGNVSNTNILAVGGHLVETSPTSDASPQVSHKIQTKQAGLPDFSWYNFPTWKLPQNISNGR
jgi:hypothetical protein